MFWGYVFAGSKKTDLTTHLLSLGSTEQINKTVFCFFFRLLVKPLFQHQIWRLGTHDSSSDVNVYKSCTIL